MLLSVVIYVNVRQGGGHHQDLLRRDYLLLRDCCRLPYTVKG